jgi:hypothetical protein
VRRRGVHRLPREVTELLRDDPELLRLAVRVAALAEEPRGLGRARRRSLLAAAIAALAAVGAATVVGAIVITGGHELSISERALAAVGTDRVLHAIVEQHVDSDRTVDLATGRQVPARVTVESWFDESTGRLHVIERRNGGLLSDSLDSANPAGSRAVRVDRALTLFLTGYRGALREGRARAAGTGVVAGRRVRWLALPGGQKSEQVAVDARSFLPVLIQASDGTRWTVARIESISEANANFRRPSPALAMPTGGGVSGRRRVSLADASRLLGARALWLGGSTGALRLAAAEIERLRSTFPTTARRRPLDSRGLALSYRGKARVAVTVREAALPLPAYGYSRGRTFSFDPVPREGSVQLTSIGGGWLGQLHSRGLYITITGPDPATVVQAARTLRPLIP